MAPWYSSPAFSIIDLATNERSNSGEFNLAVAQWSPNTAPLPVRELLMFFDPNQVGQEFTLHSRLAGGAIHRQTFTVPALDCSPGVWDHQLQGEMDESSLSITDRLGNPITVNEGAGYQFGMVAVGLDFWLTRSSDQASSPVWGDGNSNGGILALFSVFSPPPPPPPSRVTVRYAEGNWLSGGFYYDNSSSSDSISPTYESGGTLYSYDDYGNQNGSINYVLVR
jgi:hypothetical protein